MTWTVRTCLFFIGFAWVGTQTQPASGMENSFDLESGYLVSVLFDRGHISRNGLYVTLKDRLQLHSNSETGSTWSAEAAVRGFAGEWLRLPSASAVADLPQGQWALRTSGREAELNIRALALEHNAANWNLRLGYQQVAWGETFGFFIADVVNPRDLRDPLFVEMDFIRVPVAAANLKAFWGNFRVQAVATPVPRTNIMPPRGSPFDFVPRELGSIPVVDAPRYSWNRLGRDAEGGGRISYLFFEKVDVAALYYYHWNRTPVYEFGLADNAPALIEVQTRVQSVGTSFTYALDSVVFRGDALAHIGQPLQPQGMEPALRRTEYQAIVGMDYSSENEWVIGGQYHYDRFAGNQYHWVSGRIQKRLFNGKFEPEVFVFQGVGNDDCWIQPKFAWHVDAHITLNVRADLLWASTDRSSGVLAPFRGKSRALAWIQATF